MKEYKQKLREMEESEQKEAMVVEAVVDAFGNEETIAIQDLAERVRKETGLTLTDGWTVSIERSLIEGGKRGQTKRRTRYYSPGGRRFSSMSEAITELRKQQGWAENENENVVRRSSSRDAKPENVVRRSSSRDAKPVDRLSPNFPKYAARKAARSVVPIAPALGIGKAKLTSEEAELMTASEVRRVETKHKRKTVAGREKGMLKKLKALESNLVGSLNAGVSVLERALDELRGEVRKLRGKVAEQTSELAELRAAQARELAELRGAPSTVWRPNIRVDQDGYVPGLGEDSSDSDFATPRKSPSPRPLPGVTTSS